MYCRYLASVLSVGTVICLLPCVVSATEGGASLFIPGGHGPGAGIVPPPGFYFANDAFAYSGEITGGRQIQSGGAVLADVQTEVRADFLAATWVTPFDILGGRFATGASLPFNAIRRS